MRAVEIKHSEKAGEDETRDCGRWLIQGDFMNNGIQSDIKSGSFIRIGAPLTGCQIYGTGKIDEAFLRATPIPQAAKSDVNLFTFMRPDVTESIQFQDEPRDFGAAANAIREEEKARVARELHDELAQPLTALKMDAIWVRDNVAAAPAAAAAKLTDMLATLDRAVTATRRIAADLRPMLLDDLGLVPAVQWLVNNFNRRCGVACTLFVDDGLELQEPYATAVFRIVQESLANVAKHADASEVSVVIDKVLNTVLLAVQDNGRGFSTASPRKPQSLGLMGLRERAQLLKGLATIDSAPGLGTRVAVSIPVRNAGAPQ